MYVCIDFGFLILQGCAAYSGLDKRCRLGNLAAGQVAHEVGLVLVHVMKVQDLAVHHHLPRIHGQVCVIERPVKGLGGHGLIIGIVVGLKVLVVQCLASSDTLLGVEHQHLLEQVQGYKCQSESLLARVS